MPAPIVPPLSTGSDPEVLRDKKVRVVSAMRALALDNIVCGQLRGYREEERADAG